MTPFRKAERKKARLRLGVCGPAGSGKTYSALRVASGLGGRVVVVDTENGSGDLYADKFEYDIATLSPPYTPERYIELIHAAEREGYATVILDSITHAWAGEGGLLDEHDKVAKASKSGNRFVAWRQITPKHNAFIEAMLSSPCHIIATMRSKTEWVIDEDTKKPRKIGMAPVQREGMDYEFTVVFDLTAGDHLATVSKDRTGLFDGKPPFVPDEVTGTVLNGWLNDGRDAVADSAGARDWFLHELEALSKDGSLDALRAWGKKNAERIAEKLVGDDIEKVRNAYRLALVGADEPSENDDPPETEEATA